MSASGTGAGTTASPGIATTTMSTAAAAAAAADDPDVHAAIFAPLKPPYLSSTRREDLLLFKSLLEDYEALIKGTAGLAAVKIRRMLEPGLLRYLCEFELPAGGHNSDPARVGDTALRAYLTDTLLAETSTEIQDSKATVDATIRQKVVFNLQEEEPMVRIRTFLSSFKELLRVRGWSSLFPDTTAGQKEAVKTLTSLLKPAAFKQHIQEKIDRDHAADGPKKSLKAFRTLLVDQTSFLLGLLASSNVHKQKQSTGGPAAGAGGPASYSSFRQRNSSRGTGSHRGGRSHHFSPQSSIWPRGETQGAAPHWRSRGGSVSRSRGAPSHRTTSRPPPRSTSSAISASASSGGASASSPVRCFKCHGAHALSACPAASAQEKKALYDKHMNRGSGSARRIQFSIGRVASPPHTLVFPGDLEFPFCVDSGASLTFISRESASRIVDTAPPGAVSIDLLPSPLKFDLASTDAPTAVAHGTLTADVAVHSPHGHGKIERLKLYILESGRPEILIGQDVLCEFKIDVQSLFVRAISGAAPPSISPSVMIGSTSAAPHRVEDVETFQEVPRTFQAYPPFAPYMTISDRSVSSDEFPDTVHPTTGTLRRVELHQEVEFENSFHAADTITIGPKDPEALLDAVHTMIQGAKDNGMSAVGSSRLHDILHEHVDTFRLQLCADPPARVRPLEVHLKPDATIPPKSRPRRYNDNARAFLKKHMKELVEAGLVFWNPYARCASPAQATKRPGVPMDAPIMKQYRMTVDLRAVNACVEPMHQPLPSLDVVISHLRGAGYFASLDLFKGFWQSPLHENSQELHSIMTDEGIYTPTRVLQGSADASQHFQAMMQEVLGDLLYSCVLLWIDDLLIYASTEAALLDAISAVMQRITDAGLKCSATKCFMFLREAKWCGRIFSSDGVHHDPERIKALSTMSRPQSADQLIQYLAALNWMRQSVPEYNRLVATLAQLQELALKDLPSRKKTAARRVNLDEIGWSKVHDQAFAETQEALCRSATLAHPDPEQVLCLYTDASDDFWAAVLTQIPPEDLSKPAAEQSHAPIAFLSGTFKNSASRWSICEKEAFAIVQSCRRLDYVLQNPRGFKIFTDHRNLQFIFTPSARTGLHKHTAEKLERWAIFLSAFRYTIEFVSGEENLWADLLSRWGGPIARPPAQEGQPVEPDGVIATAIATETLSDSDSDDTDTDTGDPMVETKKDDDPGSELRRPRAHREALKALDMDWSSIPTEETLRQAQAHFFDGGITAASMHPPLHLDDTTGLFVDHKDRVFVPNIDNLRLKLCIGAHQGAAGHRGMNATVSAISARFTWPAMAKDVNAFVRSCLHCLPTRGGKMIPRPLAEALHGTQPNTVLHFDFLKMAHLTPKFKADPSTHSFEYLLVLKDDFSSYVDLIPTVSCTSPDVVNALLAWYARFGGIPGTWVTDQGSHFVNRIVKELSSRLHVEHHFTVAYTPWANGTVERVNRDVLNTMRTLLSDFRLSRFEWPSLVSLVVSVINSSPSARLAGLSPVQVFLGRTPSHPLDFVFLPTGKSFSDTPPSNDALLAHFTCLQKSLQDLHARVVGAPKRRGKGTAAKTHPFLFTVGDWVFVAYAGKQRAGKLQAAWHGPHEIVGLSASPLVFLVKNPSTNATSFVHASRLRFYADSSFLPTENFKSLVAQAENDCEFDVNCFLDYRIDPEQPSVWQLLTHWEGFTADSDSWEPLSSLCESAPDFVRSFLASSVRPDDLPLLQVVADKFLPVE